MLQPEATPFSTTSYANLPQFSAPVYDDSIDEFAQTRPPDDLFSDDFEPIDEPFVEEFVEPQRTSSQVPTQPTQARRPPRQAGQNGKPQTAEGPAAGTEAIPRKEYVRGDRSGTGGKKIVKLTEEELSARMEAVKLKNQSLEAAHARAEADEAAFNEREAEVQAKRKVERQNRQQMISEREKNRLRKMNAMGGREWDASKDEDADASGSSSVRGSQFRRGAHGGVAGARPTPEEEFRPSDYLFNENGSFRGRGRGGGRGRGRGRGGAEAEIGAGSARQQSVPTTTDFPSLPTTIKEGTGSTAAGGTSTPSKPSAGGGSAAQKKSWAEEMESSPVAAAVAGS